jgi:hypothetical protein
MKSRVTAAVALVLLLLLGASTVVMLLQQRAMQRLKLENARLRKSAETSGGNNAFASISPETLPGTYKWIENGELVGRVVLHPDHGLTNWRGERKMAYQWQLSDSALLIAWLKDPAVFTRIMAPGIYEASRDGRVFRLEKE